MKGSVNVKKNILTGLLMTVLLFVPPLIYTPATAAVAPQKEETAAPVQDKTPDQVHRDADVKLRVWDGKEVRETTLEEYLPGVVRGEMPPTFESAALAAQAVAERTYIYYHLQGQRKSSHPDADVCTDPGCCSAWLSPEEARKRWGDHYETYEARVDKAVADSLMRCSGKMVELRYKEYNGMLPWRGMQRYVVYEILSIADHGTVSSEIPIVVPGDEIQL